MDLRTVTGIWYEIALVNGHGAKLDKDYASKQAAERAIMETNLKAMQHGYGPSKYYIMYCTIVRLMEDNGDVVSETITKTRVG